MTPGMKISLVLAVGLVALLGGYFLIVPGSDPGATPEHPIGEPSIAAANDAFNEGSWDSGSGWSDDGGPTGRAEDGRYGALTEAVLGTAERTYPGNSASPGAFSLQTDGSKRLEFTGGGTNRSALPDADNPSRLTVPTNPGASATPSEPATLPVTANQPVSLNDSGPTYTMYLVKKDDNYWKIAKWWFGDETKHDLIARANLLVDPKRLQLGQKIRLPQKNANRPAAIKGDGRTYTVRSGDNLSRIARLYYKDESMWQVIYDANRAVIGADPDVLELGMKLTIPNHGS